MQTSSLRLRDFALAISLLVIAVYFTLRVPDFGFITPRNLSLLFIDFAITATLAVGMLLVILPGHIDLSAGSGVGLTGGIAAVLMTNCGWPAALAMLAGIVVALVLWCGMGTLIIRERIPAFIITLGGLLVFKGLFWLVIGSRTVPVSIGGKSNLYAALTTYYLPPLAGYGLAVVIAAGIAWLYWRQRAELASAEERELAFLRSFVLVQAVFLFVVLMNQFRGVPLPVLILAATAFAVWVATQHTPLGRYLYAIGGNEEAAIISGIPVERVTIAAFAGMGAIVGLTGLMQTAYGGASTTTVGELMELDAVAACVIGGTSLRGGRGTVVGVLFGALIMASLINGLTLLAVPPEVKFIARGAVLIAAVWMDVKLAQRVS